MSFHPGTRLSIVILTQQGESAKVNAPLESISHQDAVNREAPILVIHRCPMQSMTAAPIASKLRRLSVS